MTRRSVTPNALVATAFVALLVAACGSSGAVLSTVGDSVGAYGSGAGTKGSAAGATAAPVPAGQPGGQSAAQDPNGAFKDDARIVRTGTMSLRVKDIDQAVNAGRDAIRGMDGYVGASRQTNDGDKSVASITYRIPVLRWEDALASIRKLGTVLDEQTDAVEVTGQIVDLDARISNLRASERSLQAIAAQATKISDVLEVQNRLSEVRGQIEQLDAQRSHLTDQADLATLTVTYGIQVEAVTAAAKGWDAGGEVDRATASLVDMLQTVTSAGIWFLIVWLPILIVLGIVTVIGRVFVRRIGLVGRPAPILPQPPTNV